MREVSVLVIGGGPAGLTAASDLASSGHDVLVLEREATAGGIPRHCDHSGFGLSDLRRLTTGPAYAHLLVNQARASGAQIQTATMVTDWIDDHTVLATSPQGRERIRADAIVLATGARERPRSARLIPGDRVAGVFTTGQLQQLVHLQHRPIGKVAVVIGSELVSWSAVMTLRSAGVRTALVTTTDPRPDFPSTLGRLGLRAPTAASTRVTRIIGAAGRVSAVEIENVTTGEQRTIACDTVITTADWVPDHELARTAGLAMDPGSRGPVVDQVLRTSRPGVFAAGNLVHPVVTAGAAAQSGRHVANGVRRWLDQPTPAPTGAPLLVEAPLRWATPQVLHGGESATRGRLLVWLDAHVGRATFEATQGDRLLGRHRLRLPAGPGRAVSLPESLVAGFDQAGPPVILAARF